MTGIFPSNGVAPGQTQQGSPNPDVTAGCEVEYYPPRCSPRLDPFAQNALISEIVNAINALGVQYDCTKLNNLASALGNAGKTEGLPHIPPDPDDKIRGSFDGVEGYCTPLEILELGPGALPLIDISQINDNDLVYVGKAGGQGYAMRFGIFKQGFAFGQNSYWQDMFSVRSPGVVYQNQTSGPIQVSIQLSGDGVNFYVSRNGVNWVNYGTGSGNSGEKNSMQAIIPAGQFYRCDNDQISAWVELRP